MQTVSLHLENKYLDRKYGKVDPKEEHLEVTTSSGNDSRFRYII